MPEGDSIFRAARSLDDALAGRGLVALYGTRLPAARPRAGETIAGAEARGKHLLLAFSGGLVLHTHLGMQGSWRVFRPPSPAPRARVVVASDGVAAACFRPMTCELLVASQLDEHTVLAALGPDLCRPDADLDQAARRWASLADVPAGVVLLDQRVACGVGNVYRSEVLHACGVDPFAPALDDDTRRALLDTASRLLRANLGPGPRTTTHAGLAVYERANRPCRTCGTGIRAAKIGSPARAVYWCPRCQPPTRR